MSNNQPQMMTTFCRMSPPRQLRLLLVAIVVTRLAFILYIWRVGGKSEFVSPDTMTYVEPARSLLHGSFSRQGIAEIARTPGYPLLLVPAVASSLFPIALLENILLVVASAWLIWKITIELFPTSLAPAWAVLLYCLEPVGLSCSAKILSDTFFAAQILFFLWLFTGFLRKPGYLQLLFSALALGWATYTRPASLYLGLWLIPLLCFFPRTLPAWQRLGRAIVFPIVFALTLAPWFIRNAKVADYPGFSSISEDLLYFYSAAAIQAKLEHRGFTEVQSELGWNDQERYFRHHPEQRNWPEGKIARFQGAKGRKMIFFHPATYLPIHARGCAAVVFHPGIDLLRRLRLYSGSGHLKTRGFVGATLWLMGHRPVAFVGFLVLGLLLLLYYLLGCKGLKLLPLETAALFVSVSLYFILVSGGPGAVSRYRVPIMPIVCVAAGAAAASWKRESEEFPIHKRAASMV